jgi:5-methylcytosine-specific restriction endonuclease McrA
MEAALNSTAISLNADTFGDLLRSLHAVRNRRQEASKVAKRARPALCGAERKEVLDKTGGRCHLCGGLIEGAWQADHVLSHSAGGSHQVDNYLPSHELCNNYRWHYSPEEFQHILKLGVWVRTQIERKTPIGRIAATAYLAYDDTRLKRRRSGSITADQTPN